MGELIVSLGSVIEDLRDKQKDSGSLDEYNHFERMITTLNKVYDQLVYMGAQYELHYSTTKSYP